jgi:hypothetical protein
MIETQGLYYTEIAVFDFFDKRTPIIYSKSGYWATLVHAVTHDKATVRQRGGFDTLAICDAPRTLAPSQDRDLASRRGTSTLRSLSPR